MLIQFFEIFQIPQITPMALPRLLFEFKESFDKDLAMKDWNYGDKKSSELSSVNF